MKSKGLSRVLSNTTVQKYQFFSTQPSFGEGNGNRLQYSCLQNPKDGGAWQAAVHVVTKSQTCLSNYIAAAAAAAAASTTSWLE